MKLKKVLNCSCNKKHLVDDNLSNIIEDLYQLSKPLSEKRNEIRIELREKFKQLFKDKNLYNLIDDRSTQYLGLAEIINITSCIEYKSDIIHQLICEKKEIKDISKDIEYIIELITKFELYDATAETTEDEFLILRNLKNSLDNFKNDFLNFIMIFNDIIQRLDEKKVDISKVENKKELNINISGSIFSNDFNSGNKAEISLFTLG